MSDRSMWKMLHLLYTLPPGRDGLDDRELLSVGVDCSPDTIVPLLDAGVVSREGGWGGRYRLTNSAIKILGACVVANRRWSSDDLWVDHPSAFVVMPFSEQWSDRVYKEMIKPGVTAAGLDCVRGDTIPRVGDLTQNVWGALLHAGIVVADASALNANVFYELGLAHALGKDTVILKQSGSKVPADIGGAHYHEYDLAALDLGREWLTTELKQWAAGTHAGAVKEVLGK